MLEAINSLILICVVVGVLGIVAIVAVWFVGMAKALYPKNWKLLIAVVIGAISILFHSFAYADQSLINAAYDHAHKNARISGCSYEMHEDTGKFSVWEDGMERYSIVYTLYCQLHPPRKFVVAAMSFRGGKVGVTTYEITAPSGVRVE